MLGKIKKTVSLLLTILMIASVIIAVPITASAGTVIESAISWAISIANDNSHLYSQSVRWGPSYDCSSFVISAFKNAGVDTGSASYTGDMRSQLTQHGFTWIPWSQIGGVGNLIRGDILLNEATHTELYLGNSQMVGAHSSKYAAADQISVVGYSNSSNWGGVLRYNESPIPTGNDPTSYLDLISGGTGSVHVKGWTFDRDKLEQPLKIHVYIGGSSATPSAEVSVVDANVSRKDVDNVYHVGEFHGFDATIPTSKTGNVDVYIYAINIGGGGNVEIGHQTVYVSPDTELPGYTSKWINCVTNDSFRVNIVPKDNVGIKNVRVATWTQANQSDLIWHDAQLYEDCYYLDINRADYSKTHNSFYQNHFYIYDYSGNYSSISCNQDYTIKSDVGNTVAEGDYRIITAINENKALDVYGGSLENDANIQIYSNLSDTKQIFNLSYLDNGFYKIINASSQKSIDVLGDTYISGTNVVQYEYNEGVNQQWMIKPTDDGYYNIIARSNGLALDVKEGNTDDGTNVQVYTPNNTNAQKWKLRRVLNSEMISVSDFSTKTDNIVAVPNVNVTVDNKVLKENLDYTLKVTTDNNSSTGKVIITGINDYCDAVEKDFNIIDKSSMPTDETSVKITGDVTGDGGLDVRDSTAIQRAIAKIITLSDEQRIIADVNKDGGVDVRDATMVQRAIAKIITLY